MIPRRLRAAGAPAALAAALVASGCGGGGDDAPPTAPPAISVNSATYAAGSPQRLAYDQLNAARLRCGFGLLAQSAALDQAAAAHGNYMSLNSELGHGEDPGKPGFTGATPLDRALAARYAPRAVGEDISAGGSTAADAIRNLMAAPYHAKSLLTGFREVGLAWNVVASLDTLTVDLGVRVSAQLQAPQGVATFPCADTTDAVARGGNESPSPFPSNPDAQWGQPITVAGPQALRITSATITGPSGPVALLVTYGSGATADPNGAFADGWFSVIPEALQPGTSYAVAIDYTVSGTPGSARFSFATSGGR
jgi:Cysteine-rich secretory protein family